MMTSSRTEIRGKFDLPTRIALLETDMDQSDSKVQAILDGQQRLVWWAMGLVASLATTSVLLVVSLVR